MQNLNEQSARRRCIKCLLREMDKSAYMENLYDYIKRIEPDIKADEKTYENRLSTCKTCDYLEDGMCRACGCYVELRAAITANTCSYYKW